MTLTRNNHCERGSRGQADILQETLFCLVIFVLTFKVLVISMQHCGNSCGHLALARLHSMTTSPHANLHGVVIRSGWYQGLVTKAWHTPCDFRLLLDAEMTKIAWYERIKDDRRLLDRQLLDRFENRIGPTTVAWCVRVKDIRRINRPITDQSQFRIFVTHSWHK